MAVFGVASFIAGVFALGLLIVRRGRSRVQTALDHILVFVGISGVIIGIGVVFMRFS